MSQFPALEQLFGGHLHEDWADDYADFREAIDDFLEGQPGQAPAAPGEIAQLLATCDSEEALEQALVDLGLVYYPPGDGWTSHRAWLQAVADHIAKNLHSSPVA
jgi:hypothetical protein